MAAGLLGLVSNTFPLRNYGTFTIALVFFLVVELNTIGHGLPVSSPLSPPLLIDEDADEPSLVALRLDDMIGAYHRSGGLHASAPERRVTYGIDDLIGAANLEQRLTRGVDDDDDDAKLDALKAELNRQAGEIGGLTEKLIHDDQQIVDLRMVVCRLLHALCNNKGSPCLACPWKDLPTEPPVTTTTVATTTAPPTTTTPTVISTTTLPPTTTTTKDTPAPTTTTESPPSTTTAPPPKTTTAAPTTSRAPTTTTVDSTTTTSAPPTTTTAQPSTVAPATTTTPSENTTTTAAPTTAAPTTAATTAPPTTTAAPTTTETTAAPTTTTPPPTTSTTILTTSTTTAPTTTTPKPTPNPDAKCNDPKPPDNGFIVGNETKLGSHVEIKCKAGFTLVGVPMMECTALWSVEKNSFSYNWAPPMSAVCKANAGYAGHRKGKTAKKDLPKRRKRTVTKEPNEICLMPRLVGPCRAAMHRYFFNVDSGECEPFIFGGCMGNDNNFVTRDHCHEICGSR